MTPKELREWGEALLPWGLLCIMFAAVVGFAGVGLALVFATLGGGK